MYGVIVCGVPLRVTEGDAAVAGVLQSHVHIQPDYVNVSDEPALF